MYFIFTHIATHTLQQHYQHWTAMGPGFGPKPYLESPVRCTCNMAFVSLIMTNHPHRHGLYCDMAEDPEGQGASGNTRNIPVKM